MSRLPDISALDATGQAELVRRGELSPLELVNEAISRIERVNPTVNAIIHKHFERARTQAAGTLPDSPFRGVPFLLKDLGGGNLQGDPNNWGTFRASIQAIGSASGTIGGISEYSGWDGLAKFRSRVPAVPRPGTRKRKPTV
jgi:hypothetical protein